jgi:hypothetical protein
VSRRIRQTLATGLGLFGCCWFYALIMTPLLAPPATSVRISHDDSDIVVVAGSAVNVQMAESYLAESAAWATEAKLQYHSGGVYLYANELEDYASDSDDTDEADTVRFTPFALIWFPEGEKPGEVPLAMVAQSARVQFEKQFSPSNPDPGQPISGALERSVEIRGPDGLRIVGRNFIFEQAAMHVRSDHPLTFAYQEHYGSATGGMQIDLLPTQDTDSSDGLNIGGVHSVRLRRNVEMHLMLDEGDRPTHVTVHSSDGFQFFLQANVAVYKGTVAVDRPTSPVEMDSLRCDLLSLEFEEAQQEDGDTPQPDSPDSDSGESFELMNSELEFARLRADGKKVTVESESNDLSADMTELIYDARKRIVTLKEGGAVVLQHGASRLVSPEITLKLDESDQVAKAWCRGSGRLDYRDPKTGKTELTAQWQRELHKFHDETSGLDAFRLTGSAVVRHPEASMGIGADSITLWVEELDKSIRAAKQESSKGVEQASPKRLRAEQNVNIMSPELIGRTDLLDVWFEPQLTAAATDPDGAKTASHVGRRQDATSIINVGSTQSSRSLGDSRMPVDVTADWIRVRVSGVDEPDQANVDTVWADGNVNVRQQDPEKQKLLQLEGQKLRLTNQGELDQELIVFGDLARIQDGESQLAGREIHFDRVSNRVEVIGVGAIRFMVADDFEGNRLDVPRPLTVEWQDQMTFDGQSGVFLGKVSATLSDSSMHCEEMTVILNRRLSFADTDPQTEDFEIRGLVCKNGVQFDSREYKSGELTAIRKGKFWDFTLDQATGEITAEGPGVGELWRRKKKEGTILTPAAVVQANRALRPNENDWEYLRIDVAGRMTGHTKHRHSTFQDDVLVVYGPVGRPLDTIDPDALTKGAGWLRCEQLQLTQHHDKPSDTAYLRMTATGNVDMDGKSFHARADVVTYDDLKKLFVLRAMGAQAATIWQYETPGAEANGGSAQRIEFSPSRNTLILDQTSGLGLQ